MDIVTYYESGYPIIGSLKILYNEHIDGTLNLRRIKHIGKWCLLYAIAQNMEREEYKLESNFQGLEASLIEKIILF